MCRPWLLHYAPSCNVIPVHCKNGAELAKHRPVVGQPVGENPNTTHTMRMTSSKCVLQQRHLLCYESEPDPWTLILSPTLTLTLFLTVTGTKFLKENKTGQKWHRNIGQHRVIQCIMVPAIRLCCGLGGYKYSVICCCMQSSSVGTIFHEIHVKIAAQIRYFLRKYFKG